MEITGAELRERREALGLTQSALAAKLGVHVNSLARWERGELAIQNPVLVARALRDVEWEKSKRPTGQRSRASRSGLRPASRKAAL